MSIRVELFHSGGRYPELVQENLEAQFMVSAPFARPALSEAEGSGEAEPCPGGVVASHQLPSQLPMIIDEPREFLPSDIAGAEVAITIGLHPDLLLEIPYLVGPAGSKALIAPIEDPTWIKPGLQRQVTRACSKYDMESAFPKPFCSLEPQTPIISQFCEQFRVGRPQLRVQVEDGVITEVEFERHSPCGLTVRAEPALVGMRIGAPGEDPVVAVHHLGPCLASMAMDPEIGNTIMHKSEHLLREAVHKAIRDARADQ